MHNDKTAVIVEDDFLIADDLRMMCEEAGVTVMDVLGKAKGAVERIVGLAPTYLLIDVRLGRHGDGIAVADAVHSEHPSTKLVFVTASSEPPTLDRINAEEPHRVLIKPISGADLREALGA